MSVNGKAVTNAKYSFQTNEVSCTACHREVNVLKEGTVFQHPVLNVLICKKCNKFYTSGEIERGEDGIDVQCRWCGDGGQVVCCSSCSNVFCTDCIEFNFGKKELASVQAEEDWFCYVCDPRPLSELISTYKRLQQAITNKHVITVKDNDMEVSVTKGEDEGGGGDDDDDDYDETCKKVVEMSKLQLKVNLTSKHMADELALLTDNVGSIMAASKLLHNNLTSCLGKLKQSSCHDEDLPSRMSSFAHSINRKFERLVRKFMECSEKCLHNYKSSLSSHTHQSSPIKLTISRQKLSRQAKEKKPQTKDNNDEEDEEEDVDGDKKKHKHNNNNDNDEKKYKDDADDTAADADESSKKKHHSKSKTDNDRVLGNIKEKLRLKKMNIQKKKNVTPNNEEEEDDDGVDEEVTSNKRLKGPKSENGEEEVKSDRPTHKKGEKEEEDENQNDVIAKKEPTERNDDGGGDKLSAKHHHHRHHHKKEDSGEEETTKSVDQEEMKKRRRKKKKKDGGSDNDDDDEEEETLLNRPDKFFDLLTNVADRRGGGEGEEEEEEGEDGDGGKDGGGDADGSSITKIKNKIVAKKESDKETKKLNKGDGGEDGKGGGEEDDDSDEKDKSEKGGKKHHKRHGHVKKLNFDEIIDEQIASEANKTQDDPEVSKEDFEDNDDDDNDIGGILDTLRELEEDGGVEEDGLRGVEKEKMVDEAVEDIANQVVEKRKVKKPESKHHHHHHKEEREEENLKNGGEMDEEDEGKGMKKRMKKNKLLSLRLLSSDDEFDESDDGKKNGEKKGSKDGCEENEDDDDDITKPDKDEEEEEDSERELKKGGKKGRKEGRRRTKDDDDDYDDEELKEIMKEEEEEKKLKKRRRIKGGDTSDEEEEKSDKNDEEEDSSEEFQKRGKKRKRIHKIFGSKKLSRETIDAAKAEEERRRRIDERQKLFNQETTEDKDSPTKCPITTKLVLEADPETKEPLIEVHKKVISKLKPHQVDAVKFMWNCCVESLEMLRKNEGSGCLLAHCMGLGKTLSVIAFVHTMLRHTKLTKMTTTLVLTPLNTVLNWETEFENWLQAAKPLDVYEMSSVKDNWSRAEIIKTWSQEGGVLIMGYDMYRSLSQLTRVKNKKQKTIITQGLVDPGPDMVVCDEGHILKNDSTGLSKACNKIKTMRRIVLTGTPLQNNLIEYHCMVTFVKPKLLGTRKEFLNRFVNPITNGQCSDSTPRDVRIMKNRAHVLHETLSGCVQRRDYTSLTKYLLPKHEYVISIRLGEKQRRLYQEYLSRALSGQFPAYRGSRMFIDYQNLMKIWTHPWVLKMSEIKQECQRNQKDIDSFLDDSMEESWAGSDESEASLSEEDWKPKKKKHKLEGGETKEKTKKKGKCKQKKKHSSSEEEEAEEAEDEDSDGNAKKKKKEKKDEDKEEDEDEEVEQEIVKDWKSRSRRGQAALEDNQKSPDKKKKKKNSSDSSEEEGEGEGEGEDGGGSNEEVSDEWWGSFLSNEDEFCTHLSGKLVLLAEVLKLAESIGDKVLLFSQSLLSLDLVEKFLQHWDRSASRDPEKQCAGVQGWDRGIDYIRMDGSTSVQHRKDCAEMFNNDENQKVRLFLISTKAGSLGINLVAANRVIIFDASWNPSQDIQSIFRVYRFGQTKPVYVYRFLAQGTLEEKIYERQVLKQSLAQRVVDEHQVERHFTSADLSELYVFKPNIYNPDDPEPTPKLPKDRMLAELLIKQKEWIVQYHEHDSLLENRPEEELTEDERKAAWEEFEQDKMGVRNNYPSGVGMQGYTGVYNNPYLPDLQAIIQALYQQNPTLTQDELNEKAQYFMHQQVMQHQRNMMLQQQQKERERLMKLHEESLQRQRMAALQKIGTILIDDDK